MKKCTTRSPLGESSRPRELPSSLMGYMPAEVDSHQEEAGAYAIMFKEGLGKNLGQSDRWRAGKSWEGGTWTWAVKCGNMLKTLGFNEMTLAEKLIARHGPRK